MNPKRIVTILLLAFVAVSVVALVRKERAAAPSTEAAPGDASTAAAQAPAAAGDQVFVYYFHGSMRCMTCRRIEAYAREAVESTFGEELAAGRIVWREVDVEAPGNGHFVTDFELSTRSVVVARYRDGECKDWKRLDEIWQLVGNKDAFLGLVRAETGAMLEAGS